MSKVCGTSEEARNLGKLLKTAMGAVETGITGVERSGRTIQSGWRDDGAAVIEEMVSSIRTALNNAKESMPGIEKAIEEYAQFLDRR